MEILTVNYVQRLLGGFTSLVFFEKAQKFARKINKYISRQLSFVKPTDEQIIIFSLRQLLGMSKVNPNFYNASC